METMEKAIAKIFVFCLPLQMITILKPVFGIFGAQAVSMCFPVHILGMMLMICSCEGRVRIRRTKESMLLKNFGMSIILTYIVSLIMARYVFLQYGNYNGTSPFVAVTKLMLDFIQYLLIIIYVGRVFKLLGKDGVLKILHSTIRATLVLGYLQLGTIKGISLCALVYNPIATVINAVIVTSTRGVSLTLMEPSHAAMFVGAIVIPFYMAKILGGNGKKYKIELILWLPIIVFSKSTTMYLLAFAAFGIAILMSLFARRVKSTIKITGVLIFIVGIFVLTNPEWIDSVTGLNFKYLLTEKLSDTGNQSTASRMVPLVGDMLIFERFPLTGCGNGLQGYFFPEVIPDSLKSGLLDVSSREMLQGGGPLANGQLFIPGIISGYGIIGMILFGAFFYKSFKSVIKNKEDYGEFYWFYIVGLLPIVVSGFKSEFIGNYYLWFALSVPLTARRNQKRELKYEDQSMLENHSL